MLHRTTYKQLFCCAGCSSMPLPQIIGCNTLEGRKPLQPGAPKRGPASLACSLRVGSSWKGTCYCRGRPRPPRTQTNTRFRRVGWLGTSIHHAWTTKARDDSSLEWAGFAVRATPAESVMQAVVHLPGIPTTVCSGREAKHLTAPTPSSVLRLPPAAKTAV